MSIVSIVLGVIVGIGIMALLFKPLFEDREGFIDCVKFWFTPDVFSALRMFRDQVLKKTSLGSQLTSLYYSLGSEVAAVLQNNPKLKRRCARLIQRLAPFAISAVNGKHQLPQYLRDDISGFLYDLETASPPDLSLKIHDLRRRMRTIKLEDLF